MADWLKITRQMRAYHEQDLLNGQDHIADGASFMVKFPSGTVMELPARVRMRTLLQREIPLIKTEEHVYFAVPYQGISEIWLRGIDVEVQPVDTTARKAKKK